MYRLWLLFVMVLLAAAGCQSPQARLVGTWKARPVAQVKSPDFGAVARAGMLGAFTSGMTLEFNREGSFKIAQAMGAGTGTYKFVGDKIELTLNTFGPNRTIELRFGKDGRTLETATEFDSDPKVVFDKVRS